MENPKSIYYVYLFLDPTSYYAPFYVGKGKGNRAYSHLHPTRNNKTTIAKINEIISVGEKPVVTIWKQNLFESEALLLERALIARFGRVDFDDGGILTNRAAGGTGQEGITLSEETKKKMSEAALARGSTMTEDGRARLSEYARSRPADVREKIGAKHRGKGASPELRQSRSERAKGDGNPRAQTWIVEYEDGRPPETITALRSWCRERGLKYSTIYMRVRNNVGYLDGMKIKNID